MAARQGSPAQADVDHAVQHIVAGYTGLRPDQVLWDYVLTDPPLAFDSNRLAFLAMSFRGYVQSYNASQTIVAADTRKAGLTVRGLSTLVYTRITS